MDLTQILEVARFFLVEQAPLFALAGVLYTTGKVLKRIAPPASRNAFWRLYRRTLPHHPVFAGAVFGYAVDNVTMGAIAGLIATYGYDAYKVWQKYAPPKE